MSCCVVTNELVDFIVAVVFLVTILVLDSVMTIKLDNGTLKETVSLKVLQRSGA